MPTTEFSTIIVTRNELKILKSRTRKGTYQNAIRAKIVLLATQGLSDESIAARLRLSERLVAECRQRFSATRLESLEAPPAGARIDVPEPFLSRLESLYAGERQMGLDGKRHSIDSTKVSIAQGMWLYSLCRRMRPRKTLEIGFAYGFSTAFFLAAISENGIGRHTAVDPFQVQAWHGIGLQNVNHLDMERRFRFVKMPSFPALAGFGAAGEQFEIIFIDGNHRFDDVLVDFTLASEVCPIGGHIILDDLRMPSVQKVVGFIRENRKDFAGVEVSADNTAAFRRVGRDQRKWDHFRDFVRVTPTPPADSWDDRIQRLKRTIAGIVPKNESFILVDEGRLNLSDLASGRRQVQFLERNGKYWGKPKNDGQAVREISRLRRRGVNFLLFSWLAFWWLDYYSGICKYLSATSYCIASNPVVIAFDLRRSLKRL